MLYSWFNSVYTEISGSSCEVQFISGQFHSDLENVIVQRCSDLPRSFLSITESTGSQDRSQDHWIGRHLKRSLVQISAQSRDANEVG